jgi:hypothetical protein
VFVVLIDPCIPSPHLVTHLLLCSCLLYTSISNISLAKTNVTFGLNDLEFIDDQRVKGSGIIFCLDPEGHLTARVIGGGRRLSVAGIPNSLHDHLLFFESRNQKRSLKGTICAMLPCPLSFD